MRGIWVLILLILLPGVFAAVPALNLQSGSLQDNDVVGATDPTMIVSTDIRADVFYLLNGSSNTTVFLNMTDGNAVITGSVEGMNQVVLYAYNPVNYGEVTTLTITYRKDATLPSVSISRNNSGDISIGDGVSISWNATDDYVDSYNANLTDPNGAVVDISTDFSSLVGGNLNLAGEYTATVWANDTAGNIQTQSIQFDVVNSDAAVTLISPSNNAILSDDDVVFYCNASDDNGISTVEFYNNLNGNWKKDSQQNYNGLTVNFTRANINNGNYLWSCKAIDAFGSGTFANNFSLTVDDHTPDITLEAPINNFITLDNFVVFNFTVTDSVDTSLLCNLTVNTVVKQSNVGVSNGTSFGYNYTSLGSGNYTWFVICVDDAGNAQKSNEQSFSVKTQDPAPTVSVTVSEPDPVAPKETETQEQVEDVAVVPEDKEDIKTPSVTGAAATAIPKTNPVYVLIVFMILSVFMIGGLGVYFYIKDDVLARIQVRRMKNKILDKIDYLKYKYKRWKNKPY